MPAVRSSAFAALVTLLSASAPVAAQDTAQPREHAALHALATAPSEARLHDTLAHLVGFGTRHTLSDTRSNTRGIGAARRWVQAQFEAISRDCGGCLQVVTPSQVFSGDRLPRPTVVMDVVAIKRGSTDPDRVIVMSGRLDSHVSDVMDAGTTRPAPTTTVPAWRRSWKPRGCCRSRTAAPPWYSPGSPARNRACTAARCWPTTRWRRAGRSRPTSLQVPARLHASLAEAGAVQRGLIGSQRAAMIAPANFIQSQGSN